jgi:hypothetical protein
MRTPFLCGCVLLLALAGSLASIAPPRIGPAMPALTFTDAGSERCEVASTATAMNNLTAFTVIAWVYPTSTPAGNRPIFRKDANPASTNSKFVAINGGAAEWRMGVFRATTAAAAVGTGTTATLNAWQMVAATYDETDGPRMFKRTLTTPVAEISYGTQTVGAGATNTDGTTLWFGNQQHGSPSNGFPGRIAYVSYWNFRMTAAEIETYGGMRPFCARDKGCVGAWHFWRTDTNADLSGSGNNCAVTGATASAHAPLVRR